MEPLSSSSLLGSQVPSEDTPKWHITSCPSANSGYSIPSQSGTEVINSPLSSSKRNRKFDRCQMQNGSSKICEVFEVRPSKVRKKLFDLEIPADHYVATDQGVQLRANGGSFPSYCVNGNYAVAQESSGNLCLSGGVVAKSNYRKNASTSTGYLKSSIGLADLDEPAQLEEATPSPVEFFGYGNNHRETRDLNASAKSNPASVASRGEATWNYHHARPNGSLNSLYADGKGKEREWLSSAYETGLAPAPQFVEQDKLPTPFHPFHKAYEDPGIRPFHNTRDDLCKQRREHSLETFRIKRETNYTHVEPFGGGSQKTNPHPFANSSEFADSWSHTFYSWGPNGFFTQRPSFVHPNPLLLSSAVSKSPQESQSHDIYGDKWCTMGSSRLDAGLASDLPVWDRFDHRSSSASKQSPVDLPAVTFDSLNRVKVENLTSERFSTNGFNIFSIAPMVQA